MRITNSIMHKNSLTNLNKNKVYLDKLNTMQVTGKKITRPSDDPIIAIRALRLRANLAEVKQYYDRNVKDAQAWIDATEGAVESTKKILSSLMGSYDQGANGPNTTESRKAILDNLKACRDQIYADADTSYADRTVFTGYRTASTVTFQSDSTTSYKGITEGFNASDLKDWKYVSGKLDHKENIIDYDGMTAAEIDEIENGVVNNTVKRIRLAYEDLDHGATVFFEASFTPTKDADGNVTGGKITDGDGNELYTLTRTNGKFDPPAQQQTDGTYTIDDGNGQIIRLNEDGSVLGAYQSYDSTEFPPLKYREAFTASSDISSNGLSVTVKDADGNSLVVLNKTNGEFAAGAGWTVKHHEDGTYTVSKTDNTATPPVTQVVNLTASGKVMNAYDEKTQSVKITSIAGGDEAKDNAYTKFDPTDATDKVHFIPETGELIFRDDFAEELAGLKDIDGVDTIEFSYDKSDWRKGDLRPEHYFDCVDTTSTDARNWIVYDSHDQEICYDVSANQSLRVNTFASDIFIHAIGRDVDEMVGAIEDVEAAQEKVKTLEEKLEDTSLSDDDRTKLNKLLDAAKKEQTFASDKMQKMFEGGLTSFKGYVHMATLAGEQIGDRGSRLELVSDRLMDLETTVKELADDNENVDEITIMTDIKQAELAYEAALMATAKISQQSLLNYL